MQNSQNKNEEKDYSGTCSKEVLQYYENFQNIQNIKKLPFHGISSNLIDYFFIMGYEDNFINKYLLKPDSIYEPTILSTITSSQTTKKIDASLIMKIVYPRVPKKLINTTKNPSCSIFSFSFDSQNGMSKISYFGFAYYFYEKYSWNYYIPKSFVIISQYPYFTTFKKICEEIYQQYANREKSELDIPIEILIYNILNFIPNSATFSINLNIFSNNEKIRIHQLSGYPYVDYNLCEIFHYLPLNMIMEVFFFSIFEPDMVFFSSNLELLNLVMHTFVTLNYPCTDSFYFWYTFSISKEEFLSPSYSMFLVDRFNPSFYGVNCTYEENMRVLPSLHNYFVVDLDGKKFYYKSKSLNTKDGKRSSGYSYFVMHKYLLKILKEKNGVKGSKFLDKFIKKLTSDIEKALAEYNINLGSNESIAFLNNSFSIFHSSNHKDGANSSIPNFFVMNNNIHNTNRKLQEAFYDFYLNVLSIFYQDSKLSSWYDKFYGGKSKIKREPVKLFSNRNSSISLDKPGFQGNPFFLEYNANYDEFSPEESMFCSLFGDSTKYSIYFSNFILAFKCMEIYKIPLMFSEEFINLKKNNVNIEHSLFDIIDSFYVSYFNGTSQKKLYDINFTNFSKNFNKTILSQYKSQKTIKSIFLNKDIITKYIFFINNLNEKELWNLFPSSKLMKNIKIEQLSCTSVISCIENNLFKAHNPQCEDLILVSTLLITIMTREVEYFDDRADNSLRDSVFNITNQLFENLLQQNYPFLRKYIFINLHCFFKMVFKLKNSVSIQELNNYSFLATFYFIWVNYIRTNSILPNGQMIAVLSLLMDDIHDIKSLKNLRFDTCENKNSISLKNKRKGELFNQPPGFHLSLSFHSCKCGKKNDNFDIIKTITHENNDCDIKIECLKCENQTVIYPKIFIGIKNNKINSRIFSSSKIKNMAEKFLEEYLINDTIDGVDIKLFKNFLSNLFFYGKTLFNISFNEIVSFLGKELYWNVIEDKEDDDEMDSDV